MGRDCVWRPVAAGWWVITVVYLWWAGEHRLAAAGLCHRRAPFLARARSVFKLPAVSDQATTQFKQLLATPEPALLGPQPRAEVMTGADLSAKLDALFHEANLSSTRQELIRSLLLLWHDHLDASHNISQSIENADGSFVHAIMHRREPDYWNAKYWWRRVGAHPAFPAIGRRVGALFGEPPRCGGGLGRKTSPRRQVGRLRVCEFMRTSGKFSEPHGVAPRDSAN